MVRLTEAPQLTSTQAASSEGRMFCFFLGRMTSLAVRLNRTWFQISSCDVMRPSEDAACEFGCSQSVMALICHKMAANTNV